MRYPVVINSLKKSRRLRGLADQDAILLSPSHVGEIITSEKFELPYLDA